MNIYIKHMVSHRCKMLIMLTLDRIGIKYLTVELGTICLVGAITKKQKRLFEIALDKTGLELIENKKLILIEQIKTTIIEAIHYSNDTKKAPLSTYLSNKLNYNYIYLSNLFSESEGCTIAHFVIMHKIERVKELIQYEELNFSEIAFKMNYSSNAHLSNQFKKITGVTLSSYKKLKRKRIMNIENL